jgi:hypothetical protein
MGIQATGQPHKGRNSGRREWRPLVVGLAFIAAAGSVPGGCAPANPGPESRMNLVRVSSARNLPERGRLSEASTRESVASAPEEGPFELLDRYVHCLYKGEKEKFFRGVGQQGFHNTVRNLPYPNIVWYAEVNAYGYRTPDGTMDSDEYCKYTEKAWRATDRLREIAGNLSPVQEAKAQSRPRPQDSPAAAP